jgi:hypothetical protein
MQCNKQTLKKNSAREEHKRTSINLLVSDAKLLSFSFSTTSDTAAKQYKLFYKKKRGNVQA